MAVKASPKSDQNGAGGEQVSEQPNKVLKDKHVKYFKQMLSLLPQAFEGHDSTRLTLLYFSLGALDLLGVTSDMDISRKKEMIKWIYSLQVKPDEVNGNKRCGFYASDSLPESIEVNHGHIAMTYVALCSLIILGDDLSGIERDGIVNGLKSLQLKSGSFQCVSFGTESDARFVYCAACISYMLQDWRGVDRVLATQFLLSCQSYEGGFGQNTGRESHGGSTFCAVAALKLMGTFDEVMCGERRQRLMSWCLRRQETGFNGRPNKPKDTCYSFWLGSCLKLIGGHDFIDKDGNFAFLMTTQDRYMGGFSKWEDCLPDPLHSYFGLSGLFVISGEVAIHPALNISMRAFAAYSEKCDVPIPWN